MDSNRNNPGVGTTVSVQPVGKLHSRSVGRTAQQRNTAAKKTEERVSTDTEFFCSMF